MPLELLGFIAYALTFIALAYVIAIALQNLWKD